MFSALAEFERDLIRENLIAMQAEPESRKLGGAVSLVNAVKADSINREFKQVFLEVSPNNLRAPLFYREHGFVFIDEENHSEILIQTMKWESMF